jgi:N-acyl-L-homoserine lactone synthetase
MRYISGISRELPHQDIIQLYQYRYDVFIEHLNWDIVEGFGCASSRLEQDEFDTDDTIYVVAKDASDEIVGCARLLPTTKPYLLKDVFPELLNGFAAPNSSDIWELSRFTSFDLNNAPLSSTQFSSPATADLLHQAVEIAKQQGAKKLVSVSPLGVERLLRRLGFNSTRLGPPVRSHGQSLIACLIDLQ